MDSAALISSKLLTDWFADAQEPIFVVDEHGGMLFRNAAAALFRAHVNFHVGSGKLFFQPPLNGIKRVKLVCTCGGCAKIGRSHQGCSLRYAPSKNWLIFVSHLPSNLAVLHPVFVVRLVDWRPLRRIPYNLLRDLFDLERLEVAIIQGLTHNHSLRQIAAHTHRSQHAVRIGLARLLTKCGVGSTIELLALLHRLTQLIPLPQRSLVE